MEKEQLSTLIEEHSRERERLVRLKEYYVGRHEILDRTQSGSWAPNNRLVCNFAKYITDTAVGYVFGNPLKYLFEKNGEKFERAFEAAKVLTHDTLMAKNLSVYGRAYELVYGADNGDGTAPVNLAALDPTNTFVVRDDTVKKAVTSAVIYGTEKKSGDKICRVYSNETVAYYKGTSFDSLKMIKEEAHFMGRVPVIEYLNNEEGIGDFEQVTTLIDAYNKLQSDRLNDKERFVDSILLIQGCQLPDDITAAEMLQNKILELPYENADARYLTKSMNETDTEILRKAIVEDIHKFSQTPDFSDQYFAGNSTGVAIKYKPRR